MAIKIIFTFFYIQTFLSGLIAALSFYKFSMRGRLIRLIGLLFTLSFVFNLSQYAARISGYNALINLIGSVYEIVFLVMVGFIFDEATKKKLRMAIISLTTVFLFGWLANMLFFQPATITSYSKLVGSLVVLAYTLDFFYRLMMELPAIHLHRLPMFWINSAFLLYSAGTVFLWAFVEYVIKIYYDTFQNYWVFNLSLLVLQQLMIIVAVTYDLKKLGTAKLDIR